MKKFLIAAAVLCASVTNAFAIDPVAKDYIDLSLDHYYASIVNIACDFVPNQRVNYFNDFIEISNEYIRKNPNYRANEMQKLDELNTWRKLYQTEKPVMKKFCKKNKSKFNAAMQRLEASTDESGEDDS